MTNKASIKTSKTSGNGLFVTEEIGAGQLISVIPVPLIAVLDGTYMRNTCSNCFANNDNNSPADQSIVKVAACTGCQTLSYCSKVCTTHIFHE
jgi:hypothetical protein